MTTTETPAGTPVREYSPDEWNAVLDAEVQSRMDMSREEFAERYQARALDESDPDVPMLVGLIGFLHPPR